MASELWPVDLRAGRSRRRARTHLLHLVLLEERVAREHQMAIPPMDTTYFLGCESLIITSRPSGMATWREKLFASMMRNAESAARFFRLPPNRVVELGAQIEF